MRAGVFGITGDATFADCVFDCPSGGFTGVMISNGTVHLQDCTLRIAPAPFAVAIAPLQANNAEVTLVGCTVLGGDASPVFGSPGPAVQLQGSRLRVASSLLSGGAFGSHAGAVACWADVASTLWACDSTLASPSAPCPLHVANGRIARCTVTPACSPLPSGNVVGVRRLAPPQNGMPFTLELRDDAFALIAVWVALDLQTTALPGLEQALLLASASAWPAGVFVGDASGLATATWSIPSGPAFVDRPVWWQAFTAASAPWQASAIAGGLVR